MTKDTDTMNHSSSQSFDERAASWDENPLRLNLSHAVAQAIMQTIPLSPSMDCLEIGSGTGLVTMELARQVGSILATDSSQGMLAELEKKKTAAGARNITTLLLDLTRDPASLGESRFHLIYSGMTLHHIEDTLAILRTCHDLLLPLGRIAFADLAKEDGSFHPDMTGVMHLGFDPGELEELATRAGFREISFSEAHVIRKKVEGGKTKDYPVFLLTALNPLV